MTHTPGPWAVEWSTEIVAKVPSPMETYAPRMDTLTVCRCVNVEIYHDDRGGKTASNARLIAAAPDLLTAARLMLPIVKDYRETLFRSYQIGGAVKEPAEKSALDVLDAMILLAGNAVDNAEGGGA